MDYEGYYNNNKDDDLSLSSSAMITKHPKQASRYKGVIPQPNFRWGAQMYLGQTRFWLGTYRTEVDAAKMYDIAVWKIRGNQASTNFEPPFDELETCFIASRPESEILNMIRSHTYYEELRLAKEIICRKINHNEVISDHGAAGFMHHHHLNFNHIKDGAQVVLFEKVLTPSDVGKLNRLVIPKKYAEMYFPEIVRGSDGVTLSFEEITDRDHDDQTGGGHVINITRINRRMWWFRYSIWESSNSYVLTKGWRRYLVEKKLRAGDCVIFSRKTISSSSNPLNHIVNFVGSRSAVVHDYIGCSSKLQQETYCNSSSVHEVDDGDDDDELQMMTLRPNSDDMEMENTDNMDEEPVAAKLNIRLFGVDISSN